VAVDSLLIKVAEWGAQVMSAAKTRSQQQHANVLGHAAFLDAGLRFLDRRFVELFVPLTMYEPGAWPLDRRREHADEIVTFISSPDVIPRLAASIQWLETSPVSDQHIWGLTRELCQTVRNAVWADEISEVPPGPTEDLNDETWLERAKEGRAGGSPYLAPQQERSGGYRPARSDSFPTGGIYPSQGRMDPDDYAIPVVKRLVRALREDDPDRRVVAELAAGALIRPAVFVPSPWKTSASSNPQDEALGPPTISPLRGWADMQFASLLASVQQSFPGIPAPEWMWRL
jgi:hypothetical protein